jgi:hypothetical protein
MRLEGLPQSNKEVPDDVGFDVWGCSALALSAQSFTSDRESLIKGVWFGRLEQLMQDRKDPFDPFD